MTELLNYLLCKKMWSWFFMFHRVLWIMKQTVKQRLLCEGCKCGSSVITGIAEPPVMILIEDTLNM